MADEKPDFYEWYAEQQLQKGFGSVSPVPLAVGTANVRASGAPADAARSPSQYSETPRSEPDPWITDVNDYDFLSPQQPLYPFGPPNINQPRAWDYPQGYNLNYAQARMEALRMFRSMARSWGVLSTIITTRQDQLMRTPWTIKNKSNPRVESTGVKCVKEFLKRPDGQLSYSQWSIKLLFDLLEIDAPTIYFMNDRVGRPLKAVVVDGTTIFPLIDDMGLRPTTEFRISDEGQRYLLRQPAFQQIVKGMPLVDMDESELMYVPMRPRPDIPMFGYPGTEQIIVETSEAIRKTFYQVNFWAEGTIPDLVVTVPENWSPRQIAMFQAHFDAFMSGNVHLKSKVRFLPGGMKPFDIKNSSGESLWSQRDETLIRLACYAYSVSPTPFIKQVNRSVAQNAQESAEQEGLYPLMAFWKDNIIDPIIERLGIDDAEFIFLPRPERDTVKQATVLDMYVKRGIFSINRALEELGEQPIPAGDAHNIELGNSIVPVEDAARGLALPNTAGSVAASNGRTPSSGQDSKPTPANMPQRGDARPNHEPPTVAKLSTIELDDRASFADGDIRRHSRARLSAGNYRMGHVQLGGLNISIENALGSMRGKHNEDGSLRWSSTMPAHYGYVRGTIGADGDQIDVFIGRRPDLLDRVWIIDQGRESKKGNIKFDEHKVMLGYKSLRKALRDYQAAYGSRKFVGSVTEMSFDDFKSWLQNGNLTRPVDSSFGTFTAKFNATMTSGRLKSRGKKRQKREKIFYELQS